MSVYRCYSVKKPGFDVEARGLCRQLREQLGVTGLKSVTILNRYDADQIDPDVYRRAKGIVFSEPQVDLIYDEDFPRPQVPHSILAVEALPGQFDQRADSCAQCIQLMAGVERPLIAYAKVYLLEGELSQGDLDKLRGYLINPVESREAALDKPDTLVQEHPAPADVAVLDGFTALDEAGLKGLLDSLGPGHGPGRPEVPPGLLPGRGAPGPHPHRGAGGGHLLVRPLPPHHLLHPPGRGGHRRPGGEGGL